MSLPPAFAAIPLFDLLAPLWLLALWVGYAKVTAHPGVRRRSIMDRVHLCRRQWMAQMLTHEMRMVDVQVVQTLTRSITFFASTSIFVIAGLLALMGARERAREVLSELPYVVETSILLWDLKLSILLVIFIYAFFKFTWALRQFNYVAIVIGGMPVLAHDDPERPVLAERGARLATGAGDHFYAGIRAYYFSLAYLAWFLHPLLFYAATFWVVLVLYRREFRSRLLRALSDAAASDVPPEAAASR